MTSDNRTCMIILSYIQACNKDYAQSKAAQADFIICADGGQLKAREYGIIPDMVIGDFDSTTGLRRIFDCEYITYPAEKDLTDTEACVLKAIEMEFDNIVVLGGIGGRIDHTLGNVGILAEFYGRCSNLVFEDMMNRMTLLIDGTREIAADGYKYFGLFSLDEFAEGITITGAKYCLDSYTLARGTTLGISNEVQGEFARITVSNGKLLIMQANDCIDC